MNKLANLVFVALPSWFAMTVADWVTESAARWGYAQSCNGRSTKGKRLAIEARKELNKQLPALLVSITGPQLTEEQARKILSAAWNHYVRQLALDESQEGREESLVSFVEEFTFRLLWPLEKECRALEFRGQGTLPAAPRPKVWRQCTKKPRPRA